MSCARFQSCPVRGHSLGGEDHPAGVEVGEGADVVLALGCGGLIHPDPCHAGAVALVAGGVHMMFHHPPDPGVVFPGHRRDLRHRHRRREAAHQRLEQQREPRPRARPGHTDLPYPMLRAAHPGQPGMQERLVLKEVQMPPRLLHRVMHRTATMRAVLGRACEPGTTSKVGPGRGAGVATGPFPEAPFRTRRMRLGIPGSPRVLPVGQLPVVAVAGPGVQGVAMVLPR